jgi:hypothetical protein
MTAGRGLPESPAAATVTTSPRRIGVKLGNLFDPCQGIALSIRIKSGDLLRHPSSNGTRTCIRHDKTQLAQAAFTSALSHHLHPFGWQSHGLPHPQRGMM